MSNRNETPLRDAACAFFVLAVICAMFYACTAKAADPVKTDSLCEKYPITCDAPFKAASNHCRAMPEAMKRECETDLILGEEDARSQSLAASPEAVAAINQEYIVPPLTGLSTPPAARKSKRKRITPNQAMALITER